MAQYSRNNEDFNPSKVIHIVGTENVENYTVYKIEVTLGPCKWSVKHRYSEFHELHDKLHSQHKLDKGLLPPKKIFGNQSEAFIKKRQAELQQYLQVLLQHFKSVPQPLAAFLDFHRYEIHGLTQTLAEELFHKGDLILQAGELFHITPLQLHAITARLKLAEPTCETGDPKKDIGHVLDFVTRLKYLKIQGSKDAIGSSNICMNDLQFDLNCFKSLEAIELNFCKPDKICGVEHIKRSLKRIQVHYSMRTVKDILLLDVGFGQWLGGDNEAILVPAWNQLESADFSHNEISYLDESVKLMPKVGRIDLSYNRLQDLQQLQNLSALSTLNLSHNHIRALSSLHTKLGNVKVLNLAGNKLESLAGFAKLYSLEYLDVSHNEISQVLEVKHLSSLPCLEHLNLMANPVTIVLDYRTKVLECFGSRAKEVTLDKEKATQKELDTVAILLAIQKSKDAKEKARKHRPAKEATISGPGTSSSASLSSQDTDPSTSAALLAQAAPSAAGAAAHVDLTSSRDPESFRIQVEAFRQQGGAAWLTLLNQMQAARGEREEGRVEEEEEVAEERKEEKKDLPPPVQSPSQPTNPPVKQARYVYHGTVDINKILAQKHAEHASSPVSSPASSQPSVMLPETMPSRNDTTFVAILQAMLPDTHAHAQKSGVGADQHREERPVHLLWTSAVCYTDPYRQIPTCIFITTENIHVLEVKNLKGDIGWPEMEHVYCIPLMNVQQIVLGYQNLYIRVEEAFMGPQGTFTLLTAGASKTDLFLDSLKLAYRRAAPDLDQYEDPHVVVNSETDLNLRSMINTIEGQQNASDVHVLLYMLVHAVEVASPYKTNDIHTLVISSKYIYLLREDYILWPQPTFAIGPSTRPQFEIVHAFPIMGKITGIQMYDTDTISPDKEASLSQTFNATNSSSMLVANFIGYGVKLSFDLSSQGLGQKNLDVRVTTSGMRDKILAMLTQARRDYSEKGSSPSKKAKSRMKDSDSASIDSGGSGRKSKHRSKKHHMKHDYMYGYSSPRSHDKPPQTLDLQRGVVTNSSMSAKLMTAVGGSIDSMDDGFVPDQRDSPTGCSNNTESSDDTSNAVPELPQQDVESKLEEVNSPEEGHNVDVEEDKIKVEATDETQKEEVDDSREDVPAAFPGPETTFKVICSDEHEEKNNEVAPPLIDRSLQNEPQDIYKAPDIAEDEEEEEEVESDRLDLPQPQIPQIRRTPPPNSLNVVYPNIELLTHLTRCNARQALLRPLSDQMRNFSCMEGEELINHFHSNVAQIGLENEELHHVLWTEVVPYCNPLQEIPTCVLLSTRAVYFIGEDVPRPRPGNFVPKWKGHARNKSDSVQYLQRRPQSRRPDHHTSGILHHSTAAPGAMKSYCMLPLKDLKEVNIGLFDQGFRLTGKSQDAVFTCATRNNEDTESFIRKLMGVLNRIHPSPSPDPLSNDSGEQDFYKMFAKQISYSETQEYIHPSKVKFVYPNDDAIADLTYLVTEKALGGAPENVEPNIMMYTLLFWVDAGDMKGLSSLTELPYGKYHPRTLILTQNYVALVKEDLVSYPLPSFAKGLPMTKHHEILEVRNVQYLKRIVVSDFTSNDMTLVFADEMDFVLVDSNVDYYSNSSKAVASSKKPVPELSFIIVLQNLQEKDRLMKALCRQWGEMHEGQELSVQVTD